MIRKEFFTYELQLVPGKDEEWGIPQTISLIAQDVPVKVNITSGWRRVSSPEDLI